jgi:hypothetical protein
MGEFENAVHHKPRQIIGISSKSPTDRVSGAQSANQQDKIKKSGEFLPPISLKI